MIKPIKLIMLSSFKDKIIKEAALYKKSKIDMDSYTPETLLSVYKEEIIKSFNPVNYGYNLKDENNLISLSLEKRSNGKYDLIIINPNSSFLIIKINIQYLKSLIKELSSIVFIRMSERAGFKVYFTDENYTIEDFTFDCGGVNQNPPNLYRFNPKGKLKFKNCKFYDIATFTFHKDYKDEPYEFDKITDLKFVNDLLLKGNNRIESEIGYKFSFKKNNESENYFEFIEKIQQFLGIKNKITLVW